MYFDIARTIRAKLLADADIAALLVDRIHYQVMPSTSDYPHLFFRRSGSGDVSAYINCSDGPQTIYFSVEFISTKNEELVLGKIIDVLKAIKFESFQVGKQIAFIDVSDVDDDYAFVSIGEEQPDFVHGLQLIAYTQDG